MGLSTDGAQAMVGRLTRVVKRVQDVAPLVTAVHCSIQREALATKMMPAKFKTVLYEAVRTVIFIKSRPLQSHRFAILCTEMGSCHRQLLLHTEVRSFHTARCSLDFSNCKTKSGHFAWTPSLNCQINSIYLSLQKKKNSSHVSCLQ